MMLTEDQQRQIEEAIDDEKAGRKKRKAVINENARWTYNIVPYEISSSSSKSYKHLLFKSLQYIVTVQKYIGTYEMYEDSCTNNVIFVQVLHSTKYNL